MPVRPLGNRWQVTVERAKALEGFRRIRKNVATREEAKELEAQIAAALDTYGRWPVEENTPTLDSMKPRSGTLREAMTLALETHWKGMRSYRSNSYMLGALVDFFERKGLPDIDSIRSKDVDEYVTELRQKGLEASYINQVLGTLRVANDVALKRLPPIASITIPTPHLKAPKKEKWWLQPEKHKEVSEWLRAPGGDPLFADLIDVICYQGLRVEETLRLEARRFSGLDGDRPWLKPDGTKTEDAQNSIPVYPEAIPIIQRSIARADENRWKLLFPITGRQAMNRWNEVRMFLGVEDIPTATMKALRRTFAWYANNRGMPTATLQKVLRHKDIKTTSGYLNLIGSGDLEQSREYFYKDPPQERTTSSNVGAMIQAYASTPGITPEEVARFAKELMV